MRRRTVYFVSDQTGVTSETLGHSVLAQFQGLEVREVTLCADRDPDGAGERAAEEAAQRWLAEGRVVRVAIPPPGYGDFSDMESAVS